MGVEWEGYGLTRGGGYFTVLNLALCLAFI